MPKPSNQPPLLDPETGLQGMSDREMGIDWVRQIMNLPVGAIDLHVVSEEGSDLVDEAVADHNAHYRELGVADSDEGKKRDEELAATQQRIFDQDPGVAEKNQFLALLLEQCDPDIKGEEILGELKKSVGADEDFSLEEVGEEVEDYFTKSIDALAELQAAHSYNLLAFLRKFAEGVGNGPITYQDQFLGLWAIYKAGQAAAESGGQA